LCDGRAEEAKILQRLRAESSRGSTGNKSRPASAAHDLYGWALADHLGSCQREDRRLEMPDLRPISLMPDPLQPRFWWNALAGLLLLLAWLGLVGIVRLIE